MSFSDDEYPRITSSAVIVNLMYTRESNTEYNHFYPLNANKYHKFTVRNNIKLNDAGKQNG